MRATRRARRAQRRRRSLLALLALALVALPGARPDDRRPHSTIPYTVGIDETPPSRWSCWSRRCSRCWCSGGWCGGAGCRPPARTISTRWPWITTVVAGLVILNPFGLAFLAGARLKRTRPATSCGSSPSTVTAGAACGAARDGMRSNAISGGASCGAWRAGAASQSAERALRGDSQGPAAAELEPKHAKNGDWQMADTSSTSSSSARARAATSPRSARRSSASRPRSSSAISSAASARTGAASRPRRCCARPRSTTTCSTPRITGSRPTMSSFDPAAVIKRSRGVAGRMNNGVGFLMKKNKIAVIWGEAAIDAPGKITVKASKTPAPKDALGPGAIRPSTSSSRPARGRACCRGSSRTRSWSGPISRR